MLLRLIHASRRGLRIPQWMVVCCGKIENFLSLHCSNLLWNLQTTYYSECELDLKVPLHYDKNAAFLR